MKRIVLTMIVLFSFFTNVYGFNDLKTVRVGVTVSIFH